MSATGSGISEIFGFTLAAGGAAGSQVNFTHNLGTRAIQVYCCDAVTGRQLDGTEISVAQPTANVVQIANITTGAVVVNISIRWQYDTVELDTVPTTDARLATAVGPAPVAGGIVGGGGCPTNIHAARRAPGGGRRQNRTQYSESSKAFS
jgi:hypothetical protein